VKSLLPSRKTSWRACNFEEGFEEAPEGEDDDDNALRRKGAERKKDRRSNSELGAEGRLRTQSKNITYIVEGE